MSAVLVTGGSGTLGRAVVQRLLTGGDQVRALSRKPRSPQNGETWATGDLTVPRYLLECFRRGYWDNRYEVEAREYTSTEIFRYRALLAQHRSAALPPGVHPIRKKSA